MAISVTHTFVSPVADDGDPNEVGPNEWNAAHTISGLGTAAEADSTDFATAAQGALADSAVQPGDVDALVSANADVAANTAARHAAVTVTDSAEINFTLAGQDITASLIAGSIDESKLDTSVNASLDLADSAVQPAAIANMLETADIGVSVQAYSANLDEYAAVNPTAAGLALLDDVDAAAQLVTLGLTATATELNYTDGVTSAIQTQLDAKLAISSAREKLTGNRTYYVRTDGSDSNTGLANTSGGAFLTMQKAADVAYMLDFNDYTVTLKYGNDGTRTSGVTLAGLVPGQTSAIIIEGNTGNFSGVVISTTSANGITATDKAWVHVKALKVQTTTGGVGLIASDGARLETTNIVFGACATYQFNTTYSAHLTFHGSYEIAGGAVGHGHVTTESGITWETGTITLTGTPAFSSFFLGMSSNANGEFQTVTFSGSATGPKALIHDGATLFASGKDLDYLPGDSPMRVYGGGAYNDWSEPYYAYQVLAADRTLVDNNSSQTLFASATDALSFSASETYLIEGEFLVTRAAGTTSHTITLAWGGALGTGGSAKWTYWVSNPTGNVLANVQEITSVDLADAVLTAANTSATENLRLRFRGIWRAGTTASLVQPNIRYSAAPGGAPTVAKGSWMRATKLGKSDIGAVGNWS